jgi:hypothetical protein
MNVLLLTPDAVGSTLLQRLITIYMQFHKFDQPVINLHELTNGIVKYYSPEFNRELLGKKNDKWGYYQSLEEIVNLLSSVDHYKTSRLAMSHIRLRNDSIDQQVPFYQYLNDNFFIISCRRKNIFENAISHGLNTLARRLNVYSAQEKINSYFDFYKNPVELDPNAILFHLNAYKQYISWADSHFRVSSYFEYEQHLPNIEQYILNLPIFSNQAKRVTWKDTYNIEFADWNRCHRLTSDIGSLALDHKENFLQLTRELRSDTSSAVVQYHTKQIVNFLPEAQREFLVHHVKNFVKTNQSLALMHKLNILVGGLPIKKQTFAEKKYIVKNFDQLVQVYNTWIVDNPDLGQPYTDSTMDEQTQAEKAVWTANLALDNSATVTPLLTAAND